VAARRELNAPAVLLPEIQPIAVTVLEAECVGKKECRTCHGEIFVPLPKAKSASEKICWNKLRYYQNW